MDATAVEELERHGWTRYAGTIEDLNESALRLGWRPIPLRRGDPVISELRPRPKAEARPNSMSAQTGLVAQPLHTDGAHLHEPPHIVALSSSCPTPVPTRLLDLHEVDAPWDDLRHGVFRASGGRCSFQCVPLSGDGLRYDPCCMTPCDGRARRVSAFFASSFERSTKHHWTSSSPEVLLIDNRRVLHARESVDPADGPRLMRRIAFRREHR